MKVRIAIEEAYPTYAVRRTIGHEVEVSPEQVERWAEVEEAYEAAQREMSALYDAGRGVAR